MRQTFIVLTLATSFMCCNNQTNTRTTSPISNDPNACIIDTITTINIENPLDTINTSKLYGKWRLTLVWKRENDEWLGLHYYNNSEELELNANKRCEHRFFDKNGKLTDSMITDYMVHPADSFISSAYIVFYHDTLGSTKKYKKGDHRYASARLAHLLNDTILRLSSLAISKQNDKEKQIDEYRRIK